MPEKTSQTNVLEFMNFSKKVKNLDEAIELLHFSNCIKPECQDNAKREARNKILQYVKTNKDCDYASEAFPKDEILQSMLKKKREEIKISNPKQSILGAVKNALSKALPF